MDIRKEFATDVKKELEGVWIDDLAGDCKFLIARIGNSKYTQYLNELMRPHRRAMRRGLFSDEAQDLVLIKAMARTILLDWKGLTEGDVEVLYTEETAIFLLIWVSLLGSAVALRKGAHLGIDYFVGKLSKEKQLQSEIFVYLCISLFSLLVMTIGGLKLVITNFQLQQLSPVWKLPMGYVYLAVPLSGIFMLFYAMIGLVERIISVDNQDNQPATEGEV